MISVRKMAVITGVILLLMFSCGRREDNPQMNPAMMGGGNGSGEAIPVQFEEVKSEDISSFIMTTTTLEAEKQVDIIAKVPGWVDKIFVEEGDLVRKNKALAELDKREHNIAVKEAEVKVNNTKALLDRAEQMFQDNLFSKEELEKKRFDHESALAQLDKAKLNFDYAAIKAPFTGVITKREIYLGNMVTTNQVLFSIGDFDPLLAKIYVPEKEIGKLQPKQRAKLTVEMMQEKEFWGEIKMISPVVDPQSGTVKVTIEIKDKEKILRPGMFASVYIITDTHEEARVIPKKALLLESAEDVVFKYDNGIAKKVSIVKGFEDGDRIEILAGLDFGDKVITVGQEGLRDGAAVRTPDEKVASGETSARSPEGSPHGSNPNMSGSDGQLSDEQIETYLGMMLNNPEIKKEYDKRVKKDPALKTDKEKKLAFLNDMRSKMGGGMGGQRH